MGSYISKGLHWIFQNFPLLPSWHQFNLSWLEWCKPLQMFFAFLGLIPLIVHRSILEADNLLKTPPLDPNDPLAKRPKPKCPFASRPDDGFGTDVDNPTASAEGAPVGRNMIAVPKHQRNHRGGPDVQLVAQRLLAREEFQAAGPQLNIMAASWIQAMVHDWIDHYSGAETCLDKGEGVTGVELPKFKFFETLERPDGHYNAKRTMWWDASFLYGQNAEQVKSSRSGIGGKLKVDPSRPDTLPSRPDGTDYTGDNSNSWVGVTVLQVIFMKEHNYICDQLASEHPKLTDDELYGYARNIISALTAKIHTVDWTVELLKTEQLKIGMETNWYGITKALFGLKFPLFNSLLRKTQKEKNDNKGTPFCLTEEFAAVYRLHSMIPPGLVLDDEEGNPESFIGFANCITAKGREVMRKPGLPRKVMKSILSYPCGALAENNYPDSMRNVAPTDECGVDVPSGNLDLAAIDLYRDRERGIQGYNNFRRQLRLKPFETWEEMTGKPTTAKKLEAVYGPAPMGIEKCDLLVGDMYEKKIPGFAISETSFIIFLLMASRRLDSDPYLNELYTDKYYTKFGLEHIEQTRGLLDVLERHFPDIAKPFRQKKQSAFKPTHEQGIWVDKKVTKLFPNSLVARWNKTKELNNKWFKNVFAEEQIEQYKRINIGFLGIDILTLQNQKAIEKALASGDLVRLEEACPDINKLQWLPRLYLSNGRHYSSSYGYVMPMRKDPKSTRLYLGKKFAPGSSDISKFVNEAANILLDQEIKMNKEEEDKDLINIFTQAIGSRFMTHSATIPKEIVDNGPKHVTSISSSLLPANRRRSRRAVESACTFMRVQACENGESTKYDLPDDFPIDSAHLIFTVYVHAVDCLRELAKDPKLDVELMMCRRAKKLKNIPRMVIKDSTLGGLLPSDKPAKSNKTLILMDIGNAAEATDDITYAFGAGPKGGKRICCAMPAILEFLKEVQKEMQSRMKLL